MLLEQEELVERKRSSETQKDDTAKEATIELIRYYINEIADREYALGELLYRVDRNLWYNESESFRAFVEQNLRFSYRKARYLIAMYEGLANAGVDWEDVKHIGWTKLKEVAPLLTPETAAYWIKTAEKCIFSDLVVKVKAAKGVGTGITPTRKLDTEFQLDQYDNIKACVEKAKILVSTKFDSVALEYLCYRGMQAIESEENDNG